MEVKEKSIIRHVTKGLGIVEKIMSDKYAFICFENEIIPKEYLLNDLNNANIFKQNEMISIDEVINSDIIDRLFDKNIIALGKKLCADKKLEFNKTFETNFISCTVDSYLVNIYLDRNNVLQTSCQCDFPFCKHMYATFLLYRKSVLKSSNTMNTLVYTALYNKQISTAYENIFNIIEYINNENDFKLFIQALERYYKKVKAEFIYDLFKKTIYSKKIQDIIAKLDRNRLPYTINQLIMSIESEKVYLPQNKAYPIYCLLNEDVDSFYNYVTINYQRYNIPRDVSYCFDSFLIKNEVSDQEKLEKILKLMDFLGSIRGEEVFTKSNNKNLKKIIALKGKVNLSADDLKMFDNEELKELFLNYEKRNAFTLLKTVKDKLDYSDEQWVQIYYNLYYLCSKDRNAIIKALSLIEKTQYIIQLLENNSYESEAEIYDYRRYYY